MATWTEIKAFMFNNYKIDEDSGDFLRLGFSDGRTSQMVYVMNADPFVIFSSPVAKVGDVPPGKVLAGVKYFGAVQMGDFYALQHVSLMSTLDSDEITVPLRMLAAAADTLEHELTGKDTF
jgi:hypothetical protein